MSFVTAQFRAILDDKVVGDTIFKTSQFGKGGPCSLVTVIDIPPGSHTLRVKWATGGNAAGTTRLDRSTPTLLTLTLLDSLSIHQSTVVTEKVLTTGASRGLTPGRYGVPDVTIGVPAIGSTYNLLWGSGPARSFNNVDAVIIEQGINDGTTNTTIEIRMETPPSR